jgi:hypothetical protein
MMGAVAMVMMVIVVVVPIVPPHWDNFFVVVVPRLGLGGSEAHIDDVLSVCRLDEVWSWRISKGTESRCKRSS